MRPLLALLAALLAGSALGAQEKGQAPGPIQDNSFLIEEAYNQEDGVIQHISTFSRSQQNRDWIYTFTQEWPAPTQAHQLSLTLPYQRLDASADGRRGVGDLLLNYRYQLLGDGESTVALAPRLSLILPTGDEKEARGNGAVGWQVNLPLSVALGPRAVTHLNLGATRVPRARNERGERADLSGWNLGQSLIWLVRPTFNAMLEVAYTRTEQVIGPGRKTRQSAFLINPGLRWAMNFKSGLQVVPGLSFPVGLGPSKGERAVFLYLSFEHPLWNPRR
ncbi:MAG: transporter [Holophagaceae bacterium]